VSRKYASGSDDDDVDDDDDDDGELYDVRLSIAAAEGGASLA